MKCLRCHGQLAVTNSRAQAKTNQVWRRRACLSCGTLYTSHESLALDQGLTVYQVGGSTETSGFLRERLLLSIHAACRHRTKAAGDSAALTDTVVSLLLKKPQPDGTISVRSIRDITLRVLRRFDTASATQYEAFHPARRYRAS